MRYILLLSLALTAGCNQHNVRQGPSPEEQASAMCQRYGLEPQTEAYANCMMQAYQAWKSDQEWRKQMAAEYLLR